MGKIFKSINDVVFLKSKGNENLGEGSFAKVKLVCNRENPNKNYAMKTIQTRNEKERQQVYKEIQLHSSLHHDNIINFEDFLDGKKEVYIFIELAKNGDLFSYINRVKSPENELGRFFYESCKAIQYLHQKNVMHRDLKPENILLDEKNTIKVCDFGWSAEYFENVPRETLCGTFEYMAPEILLRKRQTKKTDVWALGILLYELFHGYAPFKGNRLEDVLSHISKNTIAFKKSLNPKVKELIVRILKFYPEERPTVDQILQSEFIKEYLQGKNQQIRNTSPKNNELSTVYNKGCFLKSKGQKIDTFFMEENTPKVEVSNGTKTGGQFFNIYSERNVETTPTKEKPYQSPSNGVFSSFNHGSSSNIQTPVKNYQSFNQNYVQSTGKLPFHESEKKKIDGKNPSQISSSGQMTRKEVYEQQSPMTPVTRSPLTKNHETNNYRVLSTGPERRMDNNYRVFSSNFTNCSERDLIENRQIIKKTESQTTINQNSQNQQIMGELKSFFKSPQATSFSQYCLAANGTQDQKSKKIFKLTEDAICPSRFVNYTEASPRILTPSEQNKQTVIGNGYIVRKAVSSTPNPIYRKVGMNEKSFGNYLTTFQKI